MLLLTMYRCIERSMVGRVTSFTIYFQFWQCLQTMNRRIFYVILRIFESLDFFIYGKTSQVYIGSENIYTMIIFCGLKFVQYESVQKKNRHAGIQFRCIISLAHYSCCFEARDYDISICCLQLRELF